MIFYQEEANKKLAQSKQTSDRLHRHSVIDSDLSPLPEFRFLLRSSHDHPGSSLNLLRRPGLDKARLRRL